MSTKRERLVETAERLFYLEGFHATGIDRVIAEAGVARMTLYKHFRSKEELVLAVLERRDQAYWSRLTAAVDDAQADPASPILAVFDAHGLWLTETGRYGCLFLKALGEYAGHAPKIAEVAAAHKRRVLTLMRRLVQAGGFSGDAGVDEQLVMLIEGATALAQILPPHQAARQARAAAQSLLANTHRS